MIDQQSFLKSNLKGFKHDIKDVNKHTITMQNGSYSNNQYGTHEMSEIPKTFNNPMNSAQRIIYTKWNTALPFKTTNLGKTNFSQFDAQLGGSVQIHTTVRPHTPTMGTAGGEGRTPQQPEMIQLLPHPESSRPDPVQRLDMKKGANSLNIM